MVQMNRFAGQNGDTDVEQTYRHQAGKLVGGRVGWCDEVGDWD